jgi:hypothetical protein
LHHPATGAARLGLYAKKEFQPGSVIGQFWGFLYPSKDAMIDEPVKGDDDPFFGNFSKTMSKHTTCNDFF